MAVATRAAAPESVARLLAAVRPDGRAARLDEHLGVHGLWRPWEAS